MLNTINSIFSAYIGEFQSLFGTSNKGILLCLLCCVGIVMFFDFIFRERSDSRWVKVK